jgi:hypothetical protein
MSLLEQDDKWMVTAINKTEQQIKNTAFFIGFGSSIRAQT